jgi:hypothetical protein
MQIQSTKVSRLVEDHSELCDEKTVAHESTVLSPEADLAVVRLIADELRNVAETKIDVGSMLEDVKTSVVVQTKDGSYSAVWPRTVAVANVKIMNVAETSVTTVTVAAGAIVTRIVALKHQASKMLTRKTATIAPDQRETMPRKIDTAKVEECLILLNIQDTLKDQFQHHASFLSVSNQFQNHMIF